MLKEALKELRIAKKFYRLDEAWSSDVQGVRQGQSKAAEREWVTKAAGRKQLGWKLSVKKGTTPVLLDKIYPSQEEAMQHAKVLKLPLGVTSTVPVYESMIAESIKQTPHLVNASTKAAISIVSDTKLFLTSMWNDPKSGVKKEYKTFNEFLKDGLQDHAEQALVEFKKMLDKSVAAEIAGTLEGK